MNILVINCGSSSIKLDVLDAESGVRLRKIQVVRVETPECSMTFGNEPEQKLGAMNHRDALNVVLPRLSFPELKIKAVGHRVVHGGPMFNAPVRIDDMVVEAISDLASLAPLHNPKNLEGIKAARSLLPECMHVAIFDTAFHATLPRRAQNYALPRALTKKHGIRRYGFHGPSHQWVARKAAKWLGEDLKDLRIITCHLGNGASVCAVEYGRSVETSMGMTPLEGLVMGTRSGDLDPGVCLTLMRKEGFDADALEKCLNGQSGLAGISEVGQDLRDIEAAAAEGSESAREAIQTFSHRLRKYIGAYAAVMGGVDAIVFTGGIGENSATIRHRATQRLGFLGARLDESKNRKAEVNHQAPVSDVSDARSRTKLLVVASDEAHAIAQSTAHLVREKDRTNADLMIPIAISARHIHLTESAVATLFGEGHTLTPYKSLSQPGQYACEEKLTIVGPRRQIEGVRVLGPTRPKCQVEISRTDEFHIGIDAPVRNSGDVENSPGVTLIGPVGQLSLDEGLICARRHIHMTPDDAARFGVNDRDVVSVSVDTGGRDLTFGDVLIRVKPTYALEMHIDTDEANAAEIVPGLKGVLQGTDSKARITRRDPHQLP